MLIIGRGWEGLILPIWFLMKFESLNPVTNYGLAMDGAFIIAYSSVLGYVFI
jgi:hypothetical protein